MIVTVLQPSYMPWRGYFHQILKSDLFISYDDVQYDKHGWRNRNRIKTANGVQWITIPVITSGVITNKTSIKEIKIDWNRNWNEKHWQMIKQNYSKAPYFHLYSAKFEEAYIQHPTYLADFTIELMIMISEMLGIHATKFIRSSELTGITGNKTDRLISILEKLGLQNISLVLPQGIILKQVNSRMPALHWNTWYMITQNINSFTRLTMAMFPSWIFYS